MHRVTETETCTVHAAAGRPQSLSLHQYKTSVRLQTVDLARVKDIYERSTQPLSEAPASPVQDADITKLSDLSTTSELEFIRTGLDLIMTSGESCVYAPKHLP